jgi:MSHA biogenesis protein MshK
MRRLVALGLAFGFAAGAAAQSARLADPTRPPSVAAERPGQAAARSGPQLQSVLISPTRRVAVISGNAVALGGRFGDATVATITESAVVLRYSNRRETLELIPNVDKRERRVADAAAREKGTPR